MIIWIGLVVLFALLLFSTLNPALHVPSRTRLAEEFKRTGRSELFESFVVVRPQYVLAHGSRCVERTKVQSPGMPRPR